MHLSLYLFLINSFSLFLFISLTLKNVGGIVFIQLGKCDTDFFIFRCCFRIMRLKFPKFKRDQNAAKKFRIGINESEKF